MISVVIVDDEKDARFLLRNLLEQNFVNQVDVLAEADDVDSAIEMIKKHQPDIVFLDIKMPGGSGFDVLTSIEKLNFEVVFVTAYDKFALKAFEFSAFGYLMKPIKESDLAGILDRLDEKVRRLQGDDSSKRLKVLIENYNEGGVKKIVVSNVNGFRVAALEDIIRLEGDGNYTNFILTDEQKVVSTKNLGEYEKLLLDFGFFRIHQSTVVNLIHVVGFSREGGGLVEMSDGVKAKLSRYRKDAFMERFV